MPVTVTYDFDVLNEAQDLNFGTASGNAAVTSLANGGFAGIGDHAGGISGSIYNAAGNPVTPFPSISGTNGALDQLTDGNLVIVCQDADSILYRVVNSVTGATVIATTDINLPASTNADVVALSDVTGGFVVVSQANFGGTDNDINVSIYGNDGSFRNAFALDSTTANDTGACVAQLDGGNVAFAWTRTVGANTEVWYAIRTAAGAVVKGPTLFDSQGTINQDVSISALNGGGFALAYEDNGPDSVITGISLATFDAAGNFVFGHHETQEAVSETDPSLARLANGMLAMAVVREGGTTFIELVDPTTGLVLADRDVLSSLPGTHPTDPIVAGFGTGRVTIVYNDTVAGFSGGQSESIVRTSIAGFESAVINGDDFIDNITGSFDDDTLNGGGNNDTIAGGGGADTIDGGEGDDQLSGGSGSDTINGGNGNDTIFGNAADDPDGSFLNDIIHGDAGNDTIRGGGGADTIFGDSGNDTLNGGLNNDTMRGGADNDIYIVDNAGDVVDESVGGSNGIDTVYSSALSINLADAAHYKGAVEAAVLNGAANLNLTGNALNNTLVGNAGNNTLSGAAGADYMRAGGGNDNYVIDNAGDVADESIAGSGGTDALYSSAISINLGDTAHYRGSIENAVLQGAANLNLTGNGLANVLTGNAGNNILNGGAGADILRGMGGNDNYVVDNAGDIADESIAGSGGTDAIYSSAISINLGDTAHYRGSIENAVLNGSANLNLFGNGLNNLLVGNSGNNVFDGRLGADTMVGGAGNDVFRFDTALGGGNVDRVTDYATVNDQIQIDNAVFTGLANGALGAAAFFTGTAAHDADDRIIYNSATGALFFDSDGTGGTAQIQFATLSAGLAMAAGEFTVI